VEVFQVGIGKMGGEGFEEIVMRWTTTKEAKVKGALFKNQRIDASHQDVSQVQVSIKGVPVCTSYLKLCHHVEVQPWKNALKPGSWRGGMVDQLHRKCVQRIHTDEEE